MTTPVETTVTVAPGVRLWTERRGDPRAPALLLVMGASEPGLSWPDPLVDRLAAHHQVIRYDHRDTGASTRVFDEAPYPLAELAEDAVRVLDALDVDRAHVLGLSMGGILTQLLLADHPDRLRTASLWSTFAMSTTPLRHDDGATTPVEELPGPDEELIGWLSGLTPRPDLEAELDQRVEKWRRMNPGPLPLDAADFRTREERIIAHSGRWDDSWAHALADQSGLLRTDQLAANTVPTLVIEAPADPVVPPVHARHLDQVVGATRLVTIPGLGHAPVRRALDPIADAVLAHTLA
ncbi:alpha/beta fold hydrolase [Actinoalloteichus caeruleus]|uniref:Pimeloyl-ACP methyl ester carboxylesterase n=1 Tax=Actinoalloteichus caeruleus DSM 43889 TaxID=1120930 RepID=A0ABT1JH47_ACTCY|nr:alpha/beta hydrolase [Actinoalloteichus caeruleus]MCP2331106.1 Pimeloyl-ACP methyl ester carboxylesterase [Actinoalloteichus caeruleus DSM 43889]